MSRQGNSFTQSCHLVAKRINLALRYQKYIRLAFDSNMNIFTLQSHKNTCAFFRSVQTIHFLHAVVPPGGKAYQAGLAKFFRTDQFKRP